MNEMISDLKALRFVNHSNESAMKGGIDGARARLASWRWPILATIAASLMVGLFWYFNWTRQPAFQPAQIKSLAVLPLENLSGDPAQEYFADGMTETLINNLAQIRALRVISRTSVMRFKGSRKSIAEIAKELDVDAVIEGSVQRDRGRVKITAQLIQAATERHLWADDYERDAADVLMLQGEVARAVADEIRIQLTAEERARLTAARGIDPVAHEAYLLGRFHWNKRTEEGLKKGIEYFRQAIEKNPNYAGAYAGLADCHSVLGTQFGDPQELFPKAKAYAEKALAIDATLSEARTTLASFRYLYDWDWEGAEREFNRAFELNAGYPTAHQRYSFLLVKIGRTEDGLIEIKRALDLDPISLSINSSFGSRFYYARQYDQAIEHLRKTLDMDPNFLSARIILGQVYSSQGKHAKAILELTKAAELSRYRALAALGYTYAVSGEKTKALQAMAELHEMSKHRYVSPVDIAIIYTGLGVKDQAFAWLEKGFQRRAAGMTDLKMEPMFDSLRSDPRLKELLRRMKFPE